MREAEYNSAAGDSRHVPAAFFRIRSLAVLFPADHGAGKSGPRVPGFQATLRGIEQAQRRAGPTLWLPQAAKCLKLLCFLASASCHGCPGRPSSASTKTPSTGRQEGEAVMTDQSVQPG